MQTDTTNINFQLASDFINYTNRSIFLTGKAGTGKTTFLKHIRSHSIKQMAVVAPTGVAAINAGGVTIHSFFQLPFTPYIPEGGSKSAHSNSDTIDKHSLLGRIKMNSERRKIIQQLELLVIDEISMVRADVLDAIDVVLRHFRSQHHKPFGGVQVLLIGDMFQLPPVVPEVEWSILSQYYDSPYFFDSRVMQDESAAYVELDKIYRQQDQNFIDVLNKVRNNDLDEAAFEVLHNRYQPAFQPARDDGNITLTTHNYKADSINNNALNELPGKAYAFKAIVENEFSEKSYPADETLQLKMGAQVMFIKNDSSPMKKYFNGKIGKVEKIDEDNNIIIQCKNEAEPIKVGKESWKNIRYTFNAQTQKVEEEEIGSFTQYPLRLAWAITIHKSQGLTFEKAVIDAGQAFAAGQVYVALSRCVTLEGMILQSRITNASLHSDNRITTFSNNKQKAQLPEELLRSKHKYQVALMNSLFDFAANINQCKAVIKVVEDNHSSFNAEALGWLQKIEDKLIYLQTIHDKFQIQLQQLAEDETLPELNEPLQERIKKAAVYFVQHIQNLLDVLPSSNAITDSRQNALAYNEEIKELYKNLSQQLHHILPCIEGFSVDKYHASKNNFVMKPFTVNAFSKNSSYVKDTPHALLLQQLKQIRDAISEEQELEIYRVASTKTLDELVAYLPLTNKDLKKISGFGDIKIRQYGKQFLDAINAYCREHKLSSQIHLKEAVKETKERPAAAPANKTNKVDTKQESYKLYKEGKSVAEIAAARNLSTVTIEGHLVNFIKTGEIKVVDLVSPAKIAIILSALENIENITALTPIKEQLGDDISYGEIKAVIAWKEMGVGLNS